MAEFYITILTLSCVFFFVCIWLQHRHIEKLAARNNRLHRSVGYWQENYRNVCNMVESESPVTECPTCGRGG